MQANRTQAHTNNPWLFFLLFLALSLPLWIFGPRLGERLPLPFDLPVSALTFFNPLLAALILTPGLAGKKALFLRSFDAAKIKDKRWYIPTLLLAPLISLLVYFTMRLTGMPLPDPKISLLSIPLYFALFFFGGIFEEGGWMGYAYDPLENRWGALKAALILGLVWVAIHLIPDMQMDRGLSWIFWHRLGTLASRVLMVWIYNNTGKSVFAMVLYHVMLNMGWALFPNNGSHYNPFLTTLFTLIPVAFVLLFWDPKTLTRFKPAAHPRVERTPF